MVETKLARSGLRNSDKEQNRTSRVTRIAPEKPSPFRAADAMEARAGIEPAIELLQSPALPLGYLAIA